MRSNEDWKAWKTKTTEWNGPKRRVFKQIPAKNDRKCWCPANNLISLRYHNTATKTARVYSYKTFGQRGNKSLINALGILLWGQSVV